MKRKIWASYTNMTFKLADTSLFSFSLYTVLVYRDHSDQSPFFRQPTHATLAHNTLWVSSPYCCSKSLAVKGEWPTRVVLKSLRRLRVRGVCVALPSGLGVQCPSCAGSSQHPGLVWWACSHPSLCRNLFPRFGQTARRQKPWTMSVSCYWHFYWKISLIDKKVRSRKSSNCTIVIWRNTTGKWAGVCEIVLLCVFSAGD